MAKQQPTSNGPKTAKGGSPKKAAKRIRRKAIAKGKAKELENGQRAPQPHYAIPHGGLYSIVSFPNYFCEWVEWFGFALAASPIPNFALLPGAEALLAVARGAQFTEMGRLLAPFVDSVSCTSRVRGVASSSSPPLFQPGVP